MGALTNQDIADTVYNFIDNMPAGISGTLLTLVNNAVYTAENYTGEDISITSIAEAYQPAVTNLSISNALAGMEAQGTIAKSISIGGELKKDSNVNENSSTNFKMLGLNQLNDLGHHMSYYTAWN